MSVVNDLFENSSSESEDEVYQVRPRSSSNKTLIEPRSGETRTRRSASVASSRSSKRPREESPDHSRESKLNLKISVPTFEGGTGVKKWISKFLIVTRGSSEGQKMQALTTALADDAGDWFLAEYPQHPHRTVDRWLECIAEQFPTKCTQEVMVIANRKYIAGFHHPEHFVNRVVKSMTQMAKECCVTHEDQIMGVLKRIMRNHHPEWKKLERQFPGTPQELIGQLIQVEAEIESAPTAKVTKTRAVLSVEEEEECLVGVENKVLKPSSFRTPASSNRFANQVPQRSNNSGNGFASPVSEDASTSGSRNRGPRINGNCHRCDRWGHGARWCFARMNNKGEVIGDGKYESKAGNAPSSGQ